jgi:hypothetical protein
MRFDHEEARDVESSESLPEILLPAQLEQGSRMGVALGERRLLWAMLLDAVTCFCKYRRAKDNTGRKLFREAERWIRSRDDGWSFSFQSVCDVLGLNTQQLRVSLIECVYSDVAALTRLAGEDGAVAERRARQLRHAAGSRLGGRPGHAPIRSHRPSMGERRVPLVRAASRGG